MLNFLRKRKTHQSRLDHILIRESSLSDSAHPYDPMQDLIDFTNAALHGALFLQEEMPEEAMQLYQADYYVGQVNNGGHSQFVCNAAANSITMHDVMAGLKLVGCLPMAAAFRDLQTWMTENPEDAALQNGFTTRADALETLDDRFFEAGSDVFYDAARRWMESSPKVRALPTDDWKNELAAMQSRNPQFQSRFRSNSIAALDADLTNSTIAPYRACVGGGRVHDAHFEVRHITSGSPSQHPDNGKPDFDFAHPNSQVWTIKTNVADGDTMYGLFADGRYFLCARNPETKRLSEIFGCDAPDVEQRLREAKSFAPGRFAFDLLAQHAPDDPPAFLGFGSPGRTDEDRRLDAMCFFVSTKSGKQYGLMICHDRKRLGALLIDPAANASVAKIAGREFEALLQEDHSKLT